jgi:hypothetical protein
MAIVLIILSLLVSGCATTSAANYQKRPFYLTEQDVESHGKKTWFDHLVEVDPGKAKYTVAQDYSTDPPMRIAVLPFVDQGSGQYVVDKIPISHRDGHERDEWAWTYANRLRKSMTGELAEREFQIIPLPAVDAVLQDHGIDNWQELQAIPPERLGRWLGADSVVYGEAQHYDAFYAFLVAGWQVGAHIRMVSTRDGHEIFGGTDTRNSVDLRPAFDLLDIGLNSGLTLLELRDVTLARAEDEVAREIVRRIPVSKRNIETLQMAARQQSWKVEAADTSTQTESRPSANVVSWIPDVPSMN